MGSQSTNGQEQKQTSNREIYGLQEEPVPATRAYVKEMDFDHSHVDAKSWILINDNHDARTHVNTYDGKAGSGFDAEQATYDLEGLKAKKWRKRLKEYEETNVENCPVATKVEMEDSEDSEEEEA